MNFSYVLSTIFVPGDRHVLAGLKDGKLLIIDVASGDILEEIPAHTKEVWSLCLQVDLVGNSVYFCDVVMLNYLCFSEGVLVAEVITL